MIHVLLDCLRKTRTTVFRYVVITLILWAIGLGIPYISGQYIDSLVKGIDLYGISVFVALIAVVNLVQLLCQYLRSLVTVRLNSVIAHNTSIEIFRKIFTSRYKTYSKIDSAYYVNQIYRDTGVVTGFLSANIINLFLQSATVIVSGVMLIKADLVLSIVIFSLIPFYALTFALNRSKMYKAHAEHKEKASQYFSVYSEQVNKLAFNKRNVLYDEMTSRLRCSFAMELQADLHAIRTDYVFTNLNQLVITIAYLCIVGIGGYKVTTGVLSIGYFSIINTYFNMITRSIAYFYSLAGTFQSARVSYERLQKIISEPDEQQGDTVLETIHEISIDDFTLSLGEKMVLSECNLRLERGKSYALVGKNGSGKTSLLNAVMGLFPGEYTGTVSYDGVNVVELDMRRMRRERIACLEQSPVMLNMAIREYLSLGVEMLDDRMEEQRELIRMFGIEYLLPKSLSEDGSSLSGGEKQKLALVRVLTKKADLILLDEPTSALDKESALNLQEIINVKKRSAIVLIVSHDPLFLACCDEVVDIMNIQMPSS